MNKEEWKDPFVYSGEEGLAELDEEMRRFYYNSKGEVLFENHFMPAKFIKESAYRKRVKEALEKENLKNFINSFPPFDKTTMDCVIYLGGDVKNINQLLDIQAKISGINCIEHFSWDYIPSLGPDFKTRLKKEFGFDWKEVNLNISLEKN